MTDLIIPFYNNEEEVIKTLLSIGKCEFIEITLVDDCSSTISKNFLDTIKFLQELLNVKIQIIKTKCNSGPGEARQFGLNSTNNEYIIFLDAGDLFATPRSLSQMIKIIDNDFISQVISFQHYEETKDGIFKIIPSSNNRVCGKIYRRSFLKKYNIEFPKANSRANEDTVFNQHCRLIGYYIKDTMDIDIYKEYEDIMCIWTWNDNSLTRSNNCAFYYKEQNDGLAKNAIYILNNLTQNNISQNIIDRYMYDIFIYMYLNYVGCCNKRPEFISDSFDGAYYLYKNYFTHNQIDTKLFTQVYWVNMSNENGLHQESFLYNQIPTISIFDFINMLQKRYEEEKF